MGFLESQEFVASRERCSQCGRQMRLVKEVGFMDAVAGKEDDVFHCDNCDRDFKAMPLVTGLTYSAKGIWWAIKHMK